MSTARPPRRPLLALLALALAWVPAATLATPRPLPRLEPVVVRAEAPAPAPTVSGSAAGVVTLGARR